MKITGVIGIPAEDCGRFTFHRFPVKIGEEDDQSKSGASKFHAPGDQSHQQVQVHDSDRHSLAVKNQ